ncbi:hypothetical protein [Maridesulfovibrio sp.]|uniref:hypothetical protein n=1 Tax=Maridesulfovibrio sp. TaxID=2795000 RepID=UPI0029CA8069|nr:hypothetical protein [Maridesulfovibrio sp.]
MFDHEFDDFWEQIHLTFGIDPNSKSKRDAKNFAFQSVKEIPGEVLEIAKDQIATLDSLPRNIVKQVHHAWSKWKIRNPDRIVREQGEEDHPKCPFCEDGNIFVISRKRGCAPRTTFFACGHCRVGGSTREEIERIGWEITNPKRVRQVTHAA